MRWILVLMMVMVTAGLLIKHNTWKIRTKKGKDLKESSKILLQFKQRRGKAMLFAA